MSEEMIRKMRQIPAWKRILCFVLVVALVGAVTYLITAYVIPPYTAEANMSVDMRFVKNPESVTNIANNYQAQRMAVIKSDAILDKLYEFHADTGDLSDTAKAIVKACRANPETALDDACALLGIGTMDFASVSFTPEMTLLERAQAEIEAAEAALTAAQEKGDAPKKDIKKMTAAIEKAKENLPHIESAMKLLDVLAVVDAMAQGDEAAVAAADAEDAARAKQIIVVMDLADAYLKLEPKPADLHAVEALGVGKLAALVELTLADTMTVPEMVRAEIEAAEAALTASEAKQAELLTAVEAAKAADPADADALAAAEKALSDEVARAAQIKLLLDEALQNEGYLTDALALVERVNVTRGFLRIQTRDGMVMMPSYVDGGMRLKMTEDMLITIVARAESHEQAVELCALFADEMMKAISAAQMRDMPQPDGSTPANVLTEAQWVPNNGGSVTIAVVLAVALAALVAFAILSAQPLFDSFNTIIFLLFTILCVFPFYYLFINTISDNEAVTRGLVNFLPQGVHLQNYINVFRVSDIPQAFLVTTARTVIGTVLMVLVSAWAGYLVTKQKMWKRSFMYRALVITMYFNAGLIPWYMNMFMLGLTDTFLAYILPGLVAPYNIILVKTYIESIPASLEESAIIDGAGTVTVFRKIILPLSVPILATIAIFGAVGNWNSFQDSLLLMTPGRGMETLQHRLYIHLNQTSNLGAQAAGSGQISEQTAKSMGESQVLKYTISMITVIPILLVYPFMQRFFVKGIMLGAVKG